MSHEAKTTSRRHVLTAAAAAGAILAVGSKAALAENEHKPHRVMSNNERVVRNFISAWSNLDVAELVSYFTEDGVYHNMMLEPVSGHENLTAFIGGFLSNWSETDWEITNVLSEGDTVVTERIDRTRIGDKRVDLPCAGIFEMRGGKIAVWRDYFDLATYTSAVS
jgi:limonene-1,2-epoxide hydrolase